MNDNLVNEKNQKEESEKTTKPAVVADSSDTSVGRSTMLSSESHTPVAAARNGDSIGASSEMEEEDILSDDGFEHWDVERTGMAQRIRALGIRPAWWKEKKKEQLRRDIRLSRAHLNFWNNQPQTSTTAPLQLPFDIVTCILSHIPDLETLSDAVLINKTFATSFKEFRMTITHTAVANMFGAELVDYALMLATVLAHKGPLKDKKGKISLTPPSPKTTLSSSIVREIIKIWHTTNVWVELWETDQQWRSEGSSITKKRKPLSEISRVHLIRAIIMFWAYSACARNTLKYHDGYAGCSMNTLESTGVFDYYSHTDLLEARAIFDYFQALVQFACDDVGMEGDDHYLYWQFYCVSLGPIWVLKLLDHYDSGFDEASDGEDEGFFFYHSEHEQEARGIDGIYTGFTDKAIEQTRKQFDAMKINGAIRPIDRLAEDSGNHS